MKTRSAVITKRTVERWFALGKGFATQRHACRAIAKKEIAVYAAIYVKPKFEGVKRVAEALAILFEDFDSSDEHGTGNEYWLGDGSHYQGWVCRRAKELADGAPTALIQRRTTVEDYSEPLWSWELDKDLIQGFPHADYYVEQPKEAVSA